MSTATRTNLRLAVVFCGIVGLYDGLYVIFELSGGPRIGLASDALPDFLVFHAAARAFFEGKLALVYDIDAFTRYQIENYSELIASTTLFRPFLYPPTWLLMLLPFGLMSAVRGYAVFMSVTAAAATAVEGRRDLWGWLAVITSPAAVWVVLAGQNTFFSLALLYGGLRLLDRAPAAAGVLLGLLSYKPQILVLVPLALLAARQWQALAWTLGTAVTLAAASAVLFGVDLWLAFLDVVREAGSPHIADQMFERLFMQMTTLLAAARILGLPPAVAGAIQLAGTLLAIAAVWHAFRRYGPSDARTAVLVTATFLTSPYTLNYDLLLLMPVVVALFRQASVQGLYPGERLIDVALWVIPTLCIMLNTAGLPVTPLIILAFGAIAWARLDAPSKVELPGTVTTG